MKAEEKKEDWEMLDYLIQRFWQTDQEQMLEVLSGYFYKILKKLLEKHQTKFLDYLLVQRKGEIFEGIKKHLG